MILYSCVRAVSVFLYVYLMATTPTSKVPAALVGLTYGAVLCHVLKYTRVSQCSLQTSQRKLEHERLAIEGYKYVLFCSHSCASSVPYFIGAVRLNKAGGMEDQGINTLIRNILDGEAELSDGAKFTENTKATAYFENDKGQGGSSAEDRGQWRHSHKFYDTRSAENAKILVVSTGPPDNGRA